MFQSFLIVMLLLAKAPKPAAEAPKPAETGIIAGTVASGSEETISQPVRVVLLSAQYTNLWNTDVQQRLDVYWERYKPAFAIQKEFFFEISRRAQREALDAIVFRMRRDPSSNVSEYMKETPVGGTFEFKNVPFGEYKILALGKIGGQDVIWQDSIDVHSPVPQFLELRKRLP